MAQEPVGVTRDVVGIGNAIVDVLVECDEPFLAAHGLVKGSMSLVDLESAEALHERVGRGVECSGGSAANTMVGLASLGSKAAFIGRVRDDELGRVFRREIRGAGVSFDLAPADSGPPTGRCLVLVTPDAQRTMQTYLGASSRLGPRDVDRSTIEAAAITYLEGYLWDPAPAKAAFEKAAHIARSASRRVALSLSDLFCVERHREGFREFVEHHVDLLFANEEEIRALYEARDFESAVRAVRGRCPIAALTRGPRGSVVVTREEVLEIPAHEAVRVVDTTGAGDLYASGFLHGLTRGLDPQTCGRIGGLAAAEVIGHFGARPRVRLSEWVERAL